MIRKNLVLHPFLMAVYPPLFLYAQNIGQFYFSDVIQLTLFMLGGTTVVWFLLALFTKNPKKAGVIVSLFLLLFFSYGPVKSYLGEIGSVLFMSIVWIILFAAGCYFIIRRKNSFTKLTQVLNVMFGLLFIFSVVKIISETFTGADPLTSPGITASTRDISQQEKQAGYYPDIYFIVLDAYARDDVLKEIYDFDNSEFLTYLRGKGFYIADRSAANYGQTGLTIASCFNLQYLDKFVEHIGNKTRSRQPLLTLIEKNLIFPYLRDRGYTIISFATGCAATEFENADIYLKSGSPINTFQNALSNLTIIPDLRTRSKPGDQFERHRHNILNILDNLGEVAALRIEPKFVFAHVEIPHPPFVFGSNGEPVRLDARFDDYDGDWLIRPGRLTLGEYKKRYLDQLIFVNKKTRKMVNEILSKSKRPPIILILSDHGPRSGTVWHDPKRTNVKECMANFIAVYLPHTRGNFLYPEITPVNIFRVILNEYFCEGIKLLPDKSYFSTARYLYQFHDVTKQVQRTNG